eukprot:jgi/Tetstr1/420459/TSEL_011572.t1
MARLPAAALGAVASGFPYYYSLASLWQSAFVVLLLAPLLVLVAIKARAGAATKLLSPNRPHIRGRYRTWDDHCMECAMAELTAAADFKNGKTFNLRATAKKWGIPEATLRGYFHSESGMRCSNAGRAPVLSRQEEEEVVQRILQQHANGLSLNHRQVKWLLMEIVRRVPGKQDTQSGKAWLKNGAPGYTWYRRFLNRQHDRIRARVVDNLDPKRWFVTYKDCKSLGDIMEKLLKLYPGTKASNIANLDETNITPETRKSRVLAAKGARRTHTLVNTKRFGMTCLPCVFADGSSMPPHFIVKGKRRPKWFTDRSFRDKIKYTAMQDCTLSVHENAWMDTAIFKAWFEDCFLPWTEDRRSADTPVFLILDNFSGHVHQAVLQLARQHHVIMIGLPPHSTHWTQPLDVTLMKPLKTYWTTAVNELRMTNWLDVITEQQVIELLCAPCQGLQDANSNAAWSPWSKTFRPSNIKSAFLRTGLWPIDFSMVSSDIYQAASSCGSVQEQAGNSSTGGEDGQETVEPGSAGSGSRTGAPAQPHAEKVGRQNVVLEVRTEEELELESEILRLEREAKQKRRRINQIRLHREQDATEWQISVSTLCDDMGRSQAQQAVAAKARKRRRLNTRGTGALVLNSDEEVAAAQAREELRRRRSALKSDIKASKTELRAARAEANKARKEVLKFVAAAVTQAGKARTHADKTAEAAEAAADKAAAEKACAQAGKAAAAAAEKAAASRSAVPRLDEALAATIAGIAKVAEAENILKTIEESASSGAQPEDEEDDEVEVMDDDDDAEEPQEGSGTSGAADPTAQLESAKERVEQAVESSLEAAGDAARSTQSLQLARERFVAKKAAEKEARVAAHRVQQ